MMYFLIWLDSPTDSQGRDCRKAYEFSSQIFTGNVTYTSERTAKRDRERKLLLPWKHPRKEIYCFACFLRNSCQSALPSYMLNCELSRLIL